MARIRSMLGVIEGSAGGLTFSTLNGQNILRQKVGSNGSNSAAQQVTRSRFKLLSQLYRQLSTAVQSGLKRLNGQSPYNRFMAQNFEATSVDPLTGIASIDYPKMTVSAGAVEPLAGLVVTKNTIYGTANVAYTDNSNGVTALPTDEVLVVLVNKKTGVGYAPSQIAARGDESASIEDERLTGVAPGDLLAYGFAMRADGSDASNTREVQVS